jgi:hypothetical protein
VYALKQLQMQTLLLQLQAHSDAAAGNAKRCQRHLQLQAVQVTVTCKPAASSHATASASLHPSSISRRSNTQMRVMQHGKMRMAAPQN